MQATARPPPGKGGHPQGHSQGQPPGQQDGHGRLTVFPFLWIFPMIRFSLPVSTLVFALILTACGGGRETNQAIGPRIDPSLPAPARISQARPIPGSVSQSSNTNNGVTTDRIEVIPNVVPRPWPWSWQEDGSYSIVKNNKSLGRVTKEDNFLETPTTALKADLIQYSDGDYFIYGVWSERKDGGSLSIDNLFEGDVGVFVDGSNEYKGSISSLTGTATYYSDHVEFTKYNTNSNYYRDMCGVSCVGFSLHGANTELEARRLIDLHKQYNDGFAIGDTLTGSMNLKVDFDNNNELGHIEGTIDNFTDEKIVSVRYNGAGVNPDYALTFQTVDLPGSLKLERSTFGESHSGFFDGNLSGNINGRNYSGKWGGQFYDYYGDNLDQPTHIAGTLAASSGDFNILAPWFAFRHGRVAIAEPQPAPEDRIPTITAPPEKIAVDAEDYNIGEDLICSLENPCYATEARPEDNICSLENPFPCAITTGATEELNIPYGTTIPYGTKVRKIYGSIDIFSFGLWNTVDSNDRYVGAQFTGHNYETYFSGPIIIPTVPCCNDIIAKYGNNKGFNGLLAFNSKLVPVTSDIDITVTFHGGGPVSLEALIGDKRPIYIDGLKLDKLNIGGNIWDKYGNKGTVYPGYYYNEDKVLAELSSENIISVSLSNDGTSSDAPNYIAGTLNIKDLSFNNKTITTFIDNNKHVLIGVFAAEKSYEGVIGDPEVTP